MFFYTIINVFTTLLENVNKSRTSAGRLSLNKKFKFNFKCKVNTSNTKRDALQTVMCDQNGSRVQSLEDRGTNLRRQLTVTAADKAAVAMETASLYRSTSIVEGRWRDRRHLYII
jgi:hypothetical protein